MKNKTKLPLCLIACLIAVFSLLSCSAPKEEAPPAKQLNITVLIDLSDRVSPQINPANPSHFKRDLEIIKHIAEIFVKDMEGKTDGTGGGFAAKGKIKVIFTPMPEDENINEIVKTLNIDLSKITGLKRIAAEKKKIHDTLPNIFTENLENIYSQTISQKKWIGADIWRFFKNDISDFCIEKSTSPAYRNILIVLTDGYIYHKDSIYRDKNRYSYLLPSLIENYHLRNTSDIENAVKKADFGLLSVRRDLQDLEILVLEVEPSASHKNDEDIIKIVLSKWFEEMGVSKEKYKIYNSEVPEMTKTRIDRFINGK